MKGLIASALTLMFDDFGSRLQSGSQQIVDALQHLVSEGGRRGDINPHRQSAVSISRAMRLSGSIDEFVERHRDDSKVADCAKLAIAKVILEAERGSKLYSDRRRDFDQLIDGAADSWLAYMLRDLTRGKTSAELDSAFENIYIINFNYDRCVEHFTFIWLQQVYGLDERRSAELTSRLPIYHPYGKLGPLPFEKPHSAVSFGMEVTGAGLHNIAPRIRTYSEAVSENDELSAAREALAQAKKIIFLGFAFHEQNMRILQVPEQFSRISLRCYASTLGISGPRLEMDKQQIESSLRVSAPNALFFDGVDGNCEKFWEIYGDVVVQ